MRRSFVRAVILRFRLQYWNPCRIPPGNSARSNRAGLDTPCRKEWVEECCTAGAWRRPYGYAVLPLFDVGFQWRAQGAPPVRGGTLQSIDFAGASVNRFCRYGYGWGSAVPNNE